jgi:hypothetical protein
LSVAPQNQRREVGAGHALRSSSLLGVEASQARVSQSGLKTGGGATAGGARGTIMEVASEASYKFYIIIVYNTITEATTIVFHNSNPF